jgi:hypothetical protein
MRVLMEKTYHAKKSYFLYLLGFELLLAFLGCFVVSALFSPDKSDPEPKHLIIYLIILGVFCIILAWMLLTQFHTVRIGAEYMAIGNYRYYYQDVAISKMKERLVKYKAFHLVTLKQKYHYSFIVTISRPQRRPKRFYFQSNCYADFPEFYQTLCGQIKTLQE